MSQLTDAVLGVFTLFPNEELTIKDVIELGGIKNIHSNSINTVINRFVKNGDLIRKVSARGKSGFSKWKLAPSHGKTKLSFKPVKTSTPAKVAGNAPPISKKPTLINRCFYLALAKRHLTIEDVCDAFNISEVEAFTLMNATGETYKAELKINMTLNCKH